MALSAVSPGVAPDVWRHSAATAPGGAAAEDWRAVMDRLCLPYVEAQTWADATPRAPHGEVLWRQSTSGAEFTRIDATPQRLSGRYPRQSTGIWLSALLRGEAELEVGGERVPLGPGAIFYGPTGAAASVDYRTPFRQIFVKLPHAAIQPRLLAPGGLAVGRLNPDLGASRVLFALLHAAAADLDDLDADDLRPIEMAVTELLVSCLAHQGGACARGGPAGARASQLNRIRQAIEARLSEPGLDLDSVAAAQRVSPRYLQKLFKASGDTFGHYLLTQRLARCRADLASPLCTQMSISEICFRWGFNGSAHFSRAFRDRYDASPREFRQAARRRAAP